MNAVLRHTLNRQALSSAAAVAASPLRRIGSAVRPIGVQVK